MLLLMFVFMFLFHHVNISRLLLSIIYINIVKSLPMFFFFSIPLDRVKAQWQQTNGPYHIKRLSEHYGVYEDLFPMTYCVPRVMLHMERAAVHYGNHLTLSQAEQAPQIHFEAEDNSLYGNIPGNSVSVFPARGTGVHRFYILFKQAGPVDFSADLCSCPGSVQRTFRTLDFYRKHQDTITPAGLAFFQCQWDQEPVFEYVRPPVYHPPQKKYPHGQRLRYLDHYRDGAESTYGIY
uniref:Mitochondrial ribosomal protein L38 n=1 Tax=Cyprinus carpio TaxID=7962 RepID=A0A8C2JCG1_CYPCA